MAKITSTEFKAKEKNQFLHKTIIQVGTLGENQKQKENAR